MGISLLTSMGLLLTGSYGLSFLFVLPIVILYINFKYSGKLSTKGSSKKRTDQKVNLHKDSPSTNYTSYRAELFSSIRDKKNK